MAATGDDCYFYVYSKCTKGKDCPFRHCELALGNEIICTLWRNGQCMRPNCKFKHIFSTYDRSRIPCYWEKQPTGCTRPHCPFSHIMPKSMALEIPSNNTSNNEGLTLPISTSTEAIAKSVSPAISEELSDTMRSSPNPKIIENVPVNSPPVAPLVVTIADNEESDTESIGGTPPTNADTPSKSLTNKISVIGSDIPSIGHTIIEPDFGIKTLEQLRMDKIIKESEHYYKPIYFSPISNNNALIEIEPIETSPTAEWQEKTDDFIKKCYMGKTNNSSLSRRNSRDLRDIILKKRNVQSKSPSPPPIQKKKRRIIQLKTNLNNCDDNDEPFGKVKSIIDQRSKENYLKDQFELEKPRKQHKESLDFKVKTLDEIRREKKEKKLKAELLKNATENIKPTEEKVLKLPSVANLRCFKPSQENVIVSNVEHANRSISLKSHEVPFVTMQSSVKSVQKIKVKRPAQKLYIPQPNKRSKKMPKLLEDAEELDEISPSKQSYLSMRSAFYTSKLKISPLKEKSQEIKENTKEISEEMVEIEETDELKKNAEEREEKTLTKSDSQKIKLNRTNIPVENGSTEIQFTTNAEKTDVDGKDLSPLSKCREFIINFDMDRGLLEGKKDVLSSNMDMSSQNDHMSLISSSSTNLGTDPASDDADIMNITSDLMDRSVELADNNINNCDTGAVNSMADDPKSTSNEDVQISEIASSSKVIDHVDESSSISLQITRDSISDDIDNLLKADCELNLDEFNADSTAEKEEDFLSEIDKLLKS